MALILMAPRITPRMILFYKYVCEQYLDLRQKMMPIAAFPPRFHEVLLDYGKPTNRFPALSKCDTRPGEHMHKFLKNAIRGFHTKGVNY